MSTQHFTDRMIKGLKPGSRREDYWDASVRGFVVRVTPNGAKTYCVVYRNYNGQRRRIQIGNSNLISLADARVKAKVILGQVAQGEDPAQVRQDYRRAETFSELCDAFLRFHAEPTMRPRSLHGTRLYIDGILRPRWGAWRACDVRRRDVVQLLDQIGVEQKKPVAANRVRAVISSMFTFGLRREIVETSPCVGLPAKFPEQPRDRFLTDEEIVQFWLATEVEEPVIRDVFRLLLLLGQRPGETMAMAWTHLRNNSWYIPSTLTKNRREQIVPLPEPIRMLLDAYRTKGTENVFVARGERSIQWIQKARTRIASRMEGVPHWRVYDLRRTCATGMERQGVSEATIASVLNHSKSSRQGVTAVYARHRYVEEKRVALEQWCDHILNLVKKEYVSSAHDVVNLILPNTESNTEVPRTYSP